MNKLTFMLLAAGLGIAFNRPALAAEDQAPPLAFAAPSNSDIPNTEQGKQILYGKRLLAETKRLLPENVGDGMNCNSCHLGHGKQPLGSPYVTASRNYPMYNPRAGRPVTLAERINGCFLRSMNGKAVPVDSPEMKAMLSYFEWLDQDLPRDQGPINMKGKGIGLKKLDKSLMPDPENGRKIYDQQCAMCHGGNGEGMKDAQGEYIFPPLWGDDSFNIGAGMARTYTAAAFVLHNMPVAHGLNGRLGQGNSMTEQEAIDVADYFSHQPRPDFAPKVNDWPKGGKPKDARY